MRLSTSSLNVPSAPSFFARKTSAIPPWPRRLMISKFARRSTEVIRSWFVARSPQGARGEGIDAAARRLPQRRISTGPRRQRAAPSLEALAGRLGPSHRREALEQHRRVIAGADRIFEGRACGVELLRRLVEPTLVVREPRLGEVAVLLGLRL